MNYSIAIKNGKVIDTLSKIEETRDIFIKGSRIAEKPVGNNCDIEETIDARDCIVSPGLIDFHTHLYTYGSELGIFVDSSFLPMGVTSAVDGGSTGFANFESYYKNIVINSNVRIKSFLNISPSGLITTKYHENVDPKYYDYKLIFSLFKRYKAHLLGLKIRQSKEIVEGLGIEPLKETIKIAEELGCAVAVHVTDPPEKICEITNIMRAGDILVHVFHGTGHTILNINGKIYPEIFNAKKKGIFFDAANGRNHFAFKTAIPAISQGFFPDIISTDITMRTMFRKPVFSLPFVMSKYLNLGMPLGEVFSACTYLPAKLMGVEKDIGDLSPGSLADVSIFKIIEKSVEFIDVEGKKIEGSKLLIPKLTVLNGKIVYRQIDF